jgi:cyclopropane fatty-acyl-phospholipid synthase-like methyltransferase
MKNNDHRLSRPEFPRSNQHDPDWVLANQMGPNPLWQVEWLCERMNLKPGMRVLDLGCGTALTSIFLAREFGVQVWAVDLWVHQDDNWDRIRAAKVQDRVFPVRAEAHALPFAKEFFDAAISVDAYQYFGTDLLYLTYLCRFVRPGGMIGVATVGLMQPTEGEIPQHLTKKQANGHVFWEDSCISFLTSEKWRDIWEQSGQVELIAADNQQNGWRHWRDFEIETERAGKNIFPSVAETLDEDGGKYIGFVRLVGRRRDSAGAFNLYDPEIISRLNISKS